MEPKISRYDFNTIPNETVLHILNYVDETPSVTLVCKRFFRIEIKRLRIVLRQINPCRFDKIEKNSDCLYIQNLIKAFIFDQNRFLPKESQWKIEPKSCISLSAIREKEFEISGYLCDFGEAIQKKHQGVFDRYEGKDCLINRAEWFREQFRKHGATFSELTLEYCNLKQIPEEIAYFNKLKILCIGENKLTSLPESIGTLSQLKLLGISNNKLTTLPESIGNLPKLKLLYATRNEITSVSPIVEKLLKNHCGVMF